MTKINWVRNPDGTQGVSWNPIVGCSHASVGCQNCYAEKMAMRLKKMGQAKYQNVVDENGWTGEISFCEKTLQQPLKWKKPRTIFVCSMSDLFHEKVWLSWIDKILSIVEKCPQHTFILLTKRPEEALSKLSQLCAVCDGTYSLPSNVWFLVTCENQAMADLRIPQMMKIKEKIGGASVWGLSLEPCLQRVKLGYHLPEICTYRGGPDWVIIGCESGHNRRKPPSDDDLRIMLNHCREVGVDVFLKQWDIDGKLVKMPVFNGRVWDEMPV